MEEVGHATEEAVGVERLDPEPLGEAPGDAVEGLVRQVLGELAAPPLEETDQPAADALIVLPGPLAVGIEMGEEALEGLSREAGADRGPGPVPVAHRHSPCREKPAQ